MNNQTQRYSPRQFSVFPPAVKNLILINIVFFVATAFVPAIGKYLLRYGALYPFASPHFHIWQFVTYLFLHAGFWHIGLNMFALWMFGQAIENLWGTKRFLIYYFITGIGAGLCFVLINNDPVMTRAGLQYIPTIGASGAVYGILLAFGMMFPNRRIMLLIPPIPIKAKYFVAIFGGLELILGIGGWGGSVAHFAHVGGIVFGFALIKYWGLKKVE